jgi:hypothetical protein
MVRIMIFNKNIIMGILHAEKTLIKFPAWGVIFLSED